MGYEATPEGACEAATAAANELVQVVDPGGFVIGFVMAIEVMDGDGHRCLWTLAHDGAKPWETLGYLEALRTLEVSAQVVNDLPG